MKKFISIMLTLTMFTTVIYPCQSVIAAEIKQNNALAIGQEISEMCSEYDNIVTKDGIINTRLIVKSDDKIEEYGAIDSIYGFGYVFLQYADEDNAEKALHNYENSGYIVSYDSLAICMDSANHHEWGDNWSYERVDADSALDYYNLKVKSNINIAVLDSGINYNHELFKNRVVRTNADFSTDASDDEMDKYGHGTEVAGVIANSTPSNVKISAYKVMDNKGYGTSSTIVAACSYIQESNNKPDIINFSLGVETGVIIESVIDELVNQGITVVASAGNDNREVIKAPGKCESAITVAAFDYYNKPCSFTNYGQVVDISAPGEYVYTADISSNKAYTFSNGTSLAAPFVSAAAAYVLMENKNYTPAQVKQELTATATPFKKSSCYSNLYGAGIVNFSNIINGTRCKEVTANIEGGAYRDQISVELKCTNTLVDIYYTTDGSLPTKTKGTKYTAPIDITDSTRIIAAAFARAGTPMHSKFTYLDYYILEEDESEFVIEQSGYSGIIKAYLGNDSDVVVPDVVNGIVPTQIGSQVFSNSNIESIVLPDTVVTIGDDAFSNTNLKTVTANGIENLNKRCFYNCNMLSDIDLSKVRYIGSEALFGCELLNQDLELSELQTIGDKGFAGTYFKNIKLPNCTKAGSNAFDGCTAQDIVLNNITTIGSETFKNCKNLENLYVPKVTGLGSCFEGCTNLKMVFAPMAEGLSVAIPNNATIYCSDRLMSVSFPKDYSAYKCTIVSPEYTAGLAVTNSYGNEDKYNHINSDEIAQSKGGQIRTRDNGLRFGFTFDENSINFDFKKYAEDIEYGFVYTFESIDTNKYDINDYLRENNRKVLVKSADKRSVDGTVSTYNAVFTGIPASHYSDEISARAYVYIDGMYFYSPVTTRSFSQVANAVIADDEIDQNTKNEVKQLIGKGV